MGELTTITPSIPFMQTGDVISTKVKYLPFIYHYGIYLDGGTQQYVMHNSWNGTTIEPVTDFFKLRELVSVYKSELNELSTPELLSRYQSCSGSFDLISNNCEHFVGKMMGQYPTSRQVIFWVILIVVFIAILIAIFKIKP